MAAKLTLSKIEIGFQYTTSNDRGIIDNTGPIGYAGTDIAYRLDTWSSGEYRSPGYVSNTSIGGTFPIVQGGTSSANNIIKNIKPTLDKRTDITTTGSDIDVKPYYNNGRYTNPSFTLNADNNNLVKGETLYLFPLIDISFDVSEDDGNFMSKDRVEFLYLRRDISETGQEIIVKDSDTYNIQARYLSSARYNDSYPYVLISSADNKLFPGSCKVVERYNGVCEISGLFYHPAYDGPQIGSIDNIVAYSRVGYGSNSNLYSYQGVHSIATDPYGKVTQFTIRCFCPTYMASIAVPDAIYTGQATATVTLPITRRDGMSDTSSILGESQHDIQFTVTRNQLESRTIMPYSISISFYDNYNKVYTKCLSDGGKVTEFTLQDIGSYHATDDAYPYSNYKNLIYTPSEKYDITYYSSDAASLATKYGDTLLRLCKKDFSYDPDKDFIYEYFLYYKPSMSDMQNYTEFIKKIVLETIDIDYNTKDLKDFEQLDVTCYWFPNARKLAEGISLSGGGNPSTASTVRDSITIANNALMSYPIGTDAMLGYSNYYLRLADLSDTAWYDFANAGLYYAYTYTPTTSGEGTIAFDLSHAFNFSSSESMHETYSDYDVFLNSLYTHFYNNIIDNDNILFTSIPILIRVKTTTKSKDVYNEVYLIKIIVDLRKLRVEKTNDLKLLSNSDFIKSGYFRSTYDSNPDSSSRLFTDLFLDNSADSNVSNKVMSPIDIINKDLYVFDPEGKHIKTITIDDINNLEGSSVKYNTFINYVDMYNITNANSTSTLVDSKDLQYVVGHSYTNYWITEEEYQYMTDILPNVPLLSSVFNTDHPVNSYKSCTENFDPNVGLILKNPEKGYGISVLASISKDYSSILDGGAADSLLTPLSRYDDIFLSTESLTNCHIICMYDTQPLSKSIIITNPRNIS